MSQNPDLPYSFIKDILLAQQELADNDAGASGVGNA
jgi:hypothetical protein